MEERRFLTSLPEGSVFCEESGSLDGYGRLVVVEGVGDARTVRQSLEGLGYEASSATNVLAAGMAGRIVDVVGRALELADEGAVVVLAVDNDQAGRNAALKVREKFPDRVLFAIPPEGQDIADVWEEGGGAAVLQVIDAATAKLPPEWAGNSVGESTGEQESSPDRGRSEEKGAKKRKGRTPNASIEDLYGALVDLERDGTIVRYDLFRQEVLVSGAGREDRVFDTVALSWLSRQLCRKGLHGVRVELVKLAAKERSHENEFDSLIDRLNEIGKPTRIIHPARLYSKYLGAERSDYVEAVSMYTLFKFFDRGYNPGCTNEVMPVLCNREEGVGKSTFSKCLAVSPEYYGTLDFSLSDADLTRRLRGKHIVEAAELVGLPKRDERHLKAWLTATKEEHIPKYEEYSRDILRRFVLIGTTNEQEFIPHSGNRRYAVVEVKRFDLQEFERDKANVLATAKYMFEHGKLTENWAEVVTLFKQNIVNHVQEDPFEQVITQKLQVIRHEHKFITTAEIFEVCLDGDIRYLDRPAINRIGSIMRRLRSVSTNTRESTYRMPQGAQKRAWSLQDVRLSGDSETVGTGQGEALRLKIVANQ